MGTPFSPAPIRKVFDDLDRAEPGWNLALGGIMGDPAHFASGGYHVPRNRVSGGDYSVQLADDRLGSPDAASALDITPQGGTGQAVMRRLTGNLQAAVKRQDPRIARCVREFAGTLDNQRVFAMDVRTNRVVTGFDIGHLTHVHISFIRRYANDPAALAGVAAVLAGTTTAPPDLLEEIMALNRTSTDYKNLIHDISEAVWHKVLGLPDPAKDAPAGNVLASIHTTVRADLDVDRADNAKDARP